MTFMNFNYNILVNIYRSPDILNKIRHRPYDKWFALSFY